MNWIGIVLVLFLSFQDISPRKLFLVETEDNENEWESSLEKDKETSRHEVNRNLNRAGSAHQPKRDEEEEKRGKEERRGKEEKKDASDEEPELIIPAGGGIKSSASLIENPEGQGMIQGGLANNGNGSNIVNQGGGGGQQIHISKPQIVQPDVLKPLLKLLSQVQIGPQSSTNASTTGLQSSSNVSTLGAQAGASSCEGAPERILKAINTFRARHGVDPVELDTKMSEFSQNHATSIKGSKTLTIDMHSKKQTWNGIVNAEGMSMNSSPEAAVASFYDEIKVYDFNNPVRTDDPANGHFIDMMWKSQKKIGVGCSEAGKGPYGPNKMFYYVVNYKKDQYGKKLKSEVLPAKA